MGHFLLQDDAKQQEELEHEELESEEEQLDEQEEEEHQSLTESATDSSFVTGTTGPVPPRILSPAPTVLSGPHN